VEIGKIGSTGKIAIGNFRNPDSFQQEKAKTVNFETFKVF
jgi:hypothetical protein